MKSITIELAYHFTTALLGIFAVSALVAVFLSRFYAGAPVPGWSVLGVITGFSVVNLLGLLAGIRLGMPLLDRLEFKGVHTDFPVAANRLFLLALLWITLITAVGVLQVRTALWLIALS